MPSSILLSSWTLVQLSEGKQKEIDTVHDTELVFPSSAMASPPLCILVVRARSKSTGSLL